jgi:hypothetical protein
MWTDADTDAGFFGLYDCVSSVMAFPPQRMYPDLRLESEQA